MTENMRLWDSVSETDPRRTKQVNQRGGFTAIDAQYQRRKATEVFGPYGLGWGVKNLNYGTVRAGDQILEIYLEAEFYANYTPEGGDAWVAEFPISVCMAYKPGNDSRKKLLTDATTKALSMLGFNSDVFEGKFDDSKYVEELRQKNKEKPSLDGLKATLELNKDKPEKIRLIYERWREAADEPLLSQGQAIINNYIVDTTA